MFSAGIQAEFGLAPRLKHSGVTVLGVASLHQPQFSKETAKSTKVIRRDPKLRVLRVLRGDISFSPRITDA
jgi:hypothetical protein